jgi:hypothetical protein
MAEGMTKRQYKSIEKNIQAEYAVAKAGCGALAGNANDICIADAKGKKSVAQAELEENYKPGVKTRFGARAANAEAQYSVAMERCDDKAGNDKDVCVEQAKASRVHELADATAQMKTSKADTVAYEKSADANTTAMEKAADAHKDAATAGRDADYAVAREKCKVLAGNTKDLCMSDAKVRYGQH